MPQIRSIKAREVLDSRGFPTVEVDLEIDQGTVRAIVPSGASTGKFEAHELRDKDSRFLGKGVRKAIDNINLIAGKIIGHEPDLAQIDKIMIELDSTPKKSKLGANAILGISMAVCRAGALAKDVPLFQHIAEIYGTKKYILPVPFMNIINGGKHAGNNLDIQEYMIVPSGVKSFSEAMRICSETYHTLKQELVKKFGRNAINVGDEGGFAPQLNNAEEPLELISNTINELGYENLLKLAIDCAASEFYKGSNYNFQGADISPDKLADYFLDTASKFPIISMEDPFDEEDFETFGKLTKKADFQIVGDDLLVTNVDRIKKALECKACNALLLKINQIGTVSEALNAARLAMDNDWHVMVSHRSGETEDNFIADLAVGIGSGQIKAGAPCRSERLSKYNQLLRIEEELGSKCQFGKIR